MDQDDGLETYWLYHGGRPITSIRLSRRASKAKVIAEVLVRHSSQPIPGDRGESPEQMSRIILRSEVRVTWRTAKSTGERS